MLTVAIPKRNKLQNIIVLTPKDGIKEEIFETYQKYMTVISKIYFTDVA